MFCKIKAVRELLLHSFCTMDRVLLLSLTGALYIQFLFFFLQEHFQCLYFLFVSYTPVTGSGKLSRFKKGNFCGSGCLLLIQQ